MNEEELFDNIDAYLQGELSAEEKAALERQMEKDQELAAAVEMQRLEHDAMEVLVEKDLRQKMASWSEGKKEENGDPPREDNRNKRGPWWIGILLLVLVVGFFGIRQLGNQNQEDTASPAGDSTEIKTPVQPGNRDDAAPPPREEPAPDETETPPPVADREPSPPPVETAPSNESNYLALAENFLDDPYQGDARKGAPAGTDPAAADSLTQAAEAYETGNYARVLELAAGIEPFDSRYPDFRELAGLARFRQGNYDDAARTFRDLIDNEDIAYLNDFTKNFLRQNAEWRLLITYLADSGPEGEAFQNLLREIASNENHTYQNRALDLQRALEN